MSKQLKTLHDKLMAEKPSDAMHDEATCRFCVESAIANQETSPADQLKGGSMSDKTFTEEEVASAVKKAVDEATAPLQSKLSELEGNVKQSELDTAVAAAKAESEATIADLQTKLDKAELDASTAIEARDSLQASIDAEAEAKRVEEVKAERVAKVKEVASFRDEYLTAQAERWAKMDEESFTAYLEDFSNVSAASADDTKVTQTAMTASREGNKTETAPLETLGAVRQGLKNRAL